MPLFRSNAVRSRKRSPTPSCFSHQTKHPSSPAKSSGSTAAKPPRDHSQEGHRRRPHRQLILSGRDHDEPHPNAKRISSGGRGPIANLGKKHSLSSEVGQKKVEQAQA